MQPFTIVIASTNSVLFDQLWAALQEAHASERYLLSLQQVSDDRLEGCLCSNPVGSSTEGTVTCQVVRAAHDKTHGHICLRESPHLSSLYRIAPFRDGSVVFLNPEMLVSPPNVEKIKETLSALIWQHHIPTPRSSTFPAAQHALC